MSTVMTVSSPAETFARAVLRADGAAVTACAVVLLAGARPISAFLGLDGAASLVVIGAFCLPYGAWLLWRASRDPVPRQLVRSIAVANALWVIASLALVETPLLSTGGKIVVMLKAAIVALLAIAQFRAYRRMV